MKFSRWVRKYERSILVTIAVLLAVSFGAGYGVFRMFGAAISRLAGRSPTTGPEALGRIFGEPIDPEEYYPFRNRWLRFPLAVDNLQQAASVYASVRLAQRLGVRVSDDEVRAFILRSPAFRDDPNDPKGRFSLQRFREVLDRYRISQQDFEQTVRELLAVRKLQGLLLDSAVVTSAQVWPSYRDSHLSYRTAAVRFPVEDFLAQVAEPSDEEVQTFYQAEKERRYREPARIKVEVLAAPYEAFLAGITVSDEEARRYYQEHRSEFALSPASAEGAEGREPTEEQPQVKPFAEVRDEIVERLRRDEARRRALGALDEARKKLQADPQTSFTRLAAGSDGKLEAATTDFFAATEVEEVPVLGTSFKPGDAFVSSLFSLKKEEGGGLSEVAPGAEAAVLCRLLARRESRVLPLEEVRERVVEDLRRSRAAEEARRRAEKLAEELRQKKASLADEGSAPPGLKVETSSWFRPTEPEAPEYAPQLRGHEPGDVLVAVTEDAAFVVEVLGTRPPTWEEFQKVRAGERAFQNLLVRRWLLPARWDEIVRRETGLELFAESAKPRPEAEPRAGETSGAGEAGGAAEPAESTPEAPQGAESQ